MTGRDRRPSPPPKPNRAELDAAHGRTIRDVIAAGLRVLFCGINPGLYSGATGFHFARPGNRFWPALHLGGFTDRVLAPWEEHLLLPLRLGITNVVPRTTAAADELSPAELVEGGRALRRKVVKFRPECLAILGVGAFRAAFALSKATVGPQADSIGTTRVWLLPNPSGLNAKYQLPDLAREFRRLRDALDPDPSLARRTSCAP